MVRPSKKFALFLCLIVLHQDFIQARSSYNDNLVVESSSRSRPRRSSMDILMEDRHELDQAVEKVEARHGISIRSALGKPLRRERRFIGLLAFIVSMVVTVVATTIETIYDIHGCCGLGYDYLCGFEANFNRRKNNLTVQAEAVDKQLQAALTKRDDLECMSDVLKSLWASVISLVKLEEGLIGNIHTTLKNLLIARERETKKRLENATAIMNATTIEGMFEKLSGGELALKLTLGWTAAAIPGVAYLGAKALKSYRVNKFYKLLKATKLDQVAKAAPKARKLIGFTETTAKVFLKNTAILKFSGKAGSFLKAMKIFKVAGVVMSVVSVVMDAFNIISTFVACGDKRTKAKETCASLEIAEQKIDDTRQNITDFEELLRTTLEATLRKCVNHTDLRMALEHIRDTIDNLPKPNKDVERDISIDYCNEAIPTFLELVKDPGATVRDIKDKMLDIADYCVDKLKFAYHCLETRLTMNSRILEDCSIGTDTFENLLQRQKDDVQNKKSIETCISKGEPYTTDAMFKKSLLESAEASKIFTENCKMNNKMNIEEICKGNKVEGFTDTEIEKIKKEMCEFEGGKPPKISANDAMKLCIFLLDDNPDKVFETHKEKYPDLTLDDIKGLDCVSVFNYLNREN